MAFIPQQNDINAIFLPEKQYSVRIELLNSLMMPIDSLEGVLIEGTCSIDAESEVRRTCDLVIHLEDKTLLIGEDKKIWIDKFIKVYIGVNGGRIEKTIWYNLGVYLFTQASYFYSADSKTLTLTCSDMMANLTGQLNGELPAIKTYIEEGSDVRDCIVKTITDLGFISKYIINDITVSGHPATVPYDLQFGAGDPVYSVLEKLCGLWPGWEIFFDVDGTFIYQQIPTCEEDDVFLDDTVFSESIISEQIDLDAENVRNSVIVYGMLKKDGTQIEGRFKDTNPQSPFCIDKIGARILVCSDSNYAKIYTNELANQRAEYECYLHTRLLDNVTLEMLLIPWMDVNKKIRYRSPTTGELFDYITKQITFDFTTGTMSVGAIKFYPLYPSIVSY